MARVLTLRYKDLELPMIVQKFSRDALYGKSTVEKRGEDGKFYNSYITEINSSLTLLADQNATSPFLISGLTNGTYYYIIVAFIEFGNIISNCIFVEVKLFPPNSFTLTPDADIPGYNLFFLIGILSVVIIFLSKKLKKS